MNDRFLPISLSLIEIMDLLNAFNRIPSISYFGIRRDDDFADRLNYKYTVGLLVFFSIVVANKQFSNDHIQW